MNTGNSTVTGHTVNVANKVNIPSEQQRTDIKTNIKTNINNNNLNLKVYKDIRNVSFFLALCFIVASISFFSKANSVKNDYYNSENYSSLNRNAYVGGDAYNYIINGTYFTGYSVIGCGCMLSGVIFTGIAFLAIIKNKENE
jgi:hypothetical protein